MSPRQLAFDFTPPAHCPNCDPARDEENLRVLAGCQEPWLRKCLVVLRDQSLDVSGCTPEEAERELFHVRHRAELFEVALARLLAAEAAGQHAEAA